jgi:serine phosphatase RsbU (regulator of sigma subunit)
MPRRPRARRYVAPLTSLALISSMLIALAALLPGGAAAKRATDTSTTEAAAAPAPTPAASKAEANAAAKAVKAAERAARRAERSAGSTGASEPGSEASGAAAGSSAKAGKGHDAAAARHAERRAEREARKHAAGAQPAGRAGASAQAAPSAKTTKGEREQAREQRLEREREKERAREQRRREREAKHHETRKEREAREAEEGKEAGPAVGGSSAGAQAGIAAVGVSDTAGGAPTAQSPSTAAVASSRTGRAARSRQAARHTKRAGAQTAPSNAATALGLAALTGGSGATAAEGSKHATGTAQHKRHPKQRESPIVTTVTRIIGVIPTALWALIAGLTLAAIAFALSTRVAARRARRLDRQRRELLEDVGLLQAALLPELPERLGPVATTAAYRPASGPGAGGDFYDVFALPEGLLAVIVGDVSGHGREALPHTTLLRYTLRAYLEAGLSPREALRAAAPALERQLGGSFATVVLATYDPRERLLTYSAAGHPHPILTGLDPDASIIAASAPPIGAGRPTGTRQTVVSVPGGATALFYTDGVIEARSGGELYGQRRLASALRSLGTGPAAAAGEPKEAEALLDRVAEQTDRRPDDMAAVLLELAGGSAVPRITSEELVLDAEQANGKRARRFLRAAGLGEDEIAKAIEQARAAAAESGAALLKVVPGAERPRVFVEHDNIAPLRARALARTQEVAL